MQMKRSLARCMLLAALLPASASGHELWVELLEPPQMAADVRADVKVGQDQTGTPLPYLSTTVDRMVLGLQGDHRAIPAREGDMPMINGAKVTANGLHSVTVWTRPAYIVYDTMAEFEEFLTYEGLDHIPEMHLERGLPEQAIAEEYLRNARALFQVGPVDMSEIDQPLGNAFEITALGNPFSPDAPMLSVFLSYEGNPAVDTQVSVFFRPGGAAAGSPSKRTVVRTDTQGKALIDIRQRGSYLLNAVHMVPAEGPGSVVWRSYWASLTFDLTE